MAVCGLKSYLGAIFSYLGTRGGNREVEAWGSILKPLLLKGLVWKFTIGLYYALYDLSAL